MRQTISESYLELMKQYHANPTAPFADSDGKWLDTVSGIVRSFKTFDILNYGAGKGILTHLLNKNGFSVTEYDPAVDGKDKKPERQFDFVVCVDVLEHIEPDYIEAVLDELQWYIRMGGFFSICLGQAHKHKLPDGRGAHILLRSRAWWLAELKKRWDVHKHIGRNWPERELCVVVEKQR